MIKQSWIETAKSIRSFHISKVRDNSNWRIEDTARELKRSIGSVSQYLTIASWLRTHENQIRRCGNAKDAIAFIKNKSKEMLLESDEANG